MARKKVALSYIRNQATRNASLRKRKRGLMNKTREISMLCGVDACAVIFTPHNPVPEVWPSPERARAILTSYLAVPEIDRSDKELNPLSFMRKRLRKTREKLERERVERKRRDLAWFMYRCIAGRDSMDRLDMRDRAEMDWVINHAMRNIIRTTKEKLVVRDGHDASTLDAVMMALPPLPPPVAPPPAVVEETMDGSLMGLGWDIPEWDREFNDDEI